MRNQCTHWRNQGVVQLGQGLPQALEVFLLLPGSFGSFRFFTTKTKNIWQFYNLWPRTWSLIQHYSSRASTLIYVIACHLELGKIQLVNTYIVCTSLYLGKNSSVLSFSISVIFWWNHLWLILWWKLVL